MAKLRLPPKGCLYHGVYATHSDVPGELPPPTDCEAGWFDPKHYEDYLDAVGRGDANGPDGVAWVHLTSEWRNPKCREFPTKAINALEPLGGKAGKPAVPYIYFWPMTGQKQEGIDQAYDLALIADGGIRHEYKRWFEGAADYGKPLMIAPAWECNGSWKAWNAHHYEGRNNIRGTELYRRAVRRIIADARSLGADNITWVWEVIDHDSPRTPYNRLEDYYPGDDVIDWVGVSVYGAKSGGAFDSDEHNKFQEGFEPVYTRLQAMKESRLMAREKPIFISEMGCCGNLVDSDQDTDTQAADWAREAFTYLFDRKAAGDLEDVIGFNWWNEMWETGEKSNPISVELRAAKLKELGKTMKELFARNHGRLQTWIDVETEE